MAEADVTEIVDHKDIPFREQSFGFLEEGFTVSDPDEFGDVAVNGRCPACRGDTQYVFPLAAPDVVGKSFRRAAPKAPPVKQRLVYCKCRFVHGQEELGCGATWRAQA